ncbi:MAG: polysaccharide biosynthesis protein [Flavobacterium sp.]|nr:polysaccharide biosynthesis protein [Pedobacter sp.]
MKKINYRERVFPKWVIFIVDQAIILACLSISFIITIQFQFKGLINEPFLLYTAIYMIIAAITFTKMQIHTGILRYSNTVDILRIFYSVLLTTIIYSAVIKLLVIPLTNIQWQGFNLAVLLNFFISTSILILLRIGVKSLFNYIKCHQNSNAERILIYGSDRSSILLKQALEVRLENKYDIIGFVDDDIDKVNKHIEQKRVYHSSSIKALKNKCKIDYLVVMSNSLNINGKKSAINICMEEGIKIQTVPPAHQWLYGKLELKQIKDLRIEDLLQREVIILKKNNILNEIVGKRILVTGAAGSIGSEMVRQVLSYNPQQVILCDQAETPLHELQLEMEDDFSGQNCVIYMADIQNEERIRELFSTYKPQIVFHAAAYKHVPMMEGNPREAVLTNILGTKNLADLALEFNVEKFIMISTDKAVNPTNVMGASKRIAEIYIQSLNGLKETDYNGYIKKRTKFITTRFGNVLGSNGSVISRFKAQLEKGGPLTVTHPEITRFFMTIAEAVQLVMEAAAMGNGGEIYIFDMGEPVKIVDLARNMIQLSGLSPDNDIEIIFSGLRPGEKLYEELLNKDESSMPTHHQKIKVSRVITYPFDYVNQAVVELTDCKESNYIIVKKMKEIVPEFKSNNSIYETLDVLNVY